MKLWLVKRTDKVDYDEYEAEIVAAETEDEARHTHPHGPGTFVYANGLGWRREGDDEITRWCLWTHDLASLAVDAVGEAAPGVTGIVLASFNAG